MGQAYHLGLKHVLRPLYDRLDRSAALRRFAAAYVYNKPAHADFAATAVLTFLSTTVAFGVALRYQLVHGHLPWALHAAYNCAWVGIGGRMMGSAYTFAHKEGHNGVLYQRWVRRTVGNLFENWVGLLYGNVPYNFTTSHNHIHHALDGGKGDTFYCYDLDRSSLSDFMLYQRRIFLHMAGLSSLRYFRLRGMHKQERLLARGCAIFWLAFPLPLLLLTRSPWFLCVVWLQPLCAMSFFLALVNWAFHAFIELDASGRHLPHVNALTILDGQDDNFGEDDHMAHHYENPIAHARSRHDAWRARIMPELKANRASIFKEISIVELGILTLLGQFERIAERHYVDFSGELSTAQVAEMLRRRARTKESTHEEYLAWEAETEAALLASPPPKDD
ncbi:hypothetical protein EMIHUDRAFT_438508 [Emiliania huxleyi CCMP1516]|uniref:Fatty acid desaturase domain-containing protein n=4 Tax=Emiliania huxleyi TaxID=2903 RepID=A0A0D3I8Y4_EMIH1|nr:hypothetical protein EMIHUDRAFT_438508 [Emiliania huxleyi CCMP1516]EOD07719.1 hypothetical protein EMIHUDRAFT_438508 [Emiliania huxleyi CCMP1516]|mmetsp:Transcript_24559/g.80875  ORF Transcript_24559/g.80875 Transcript_24559/m.80875 type:complete len:391 (-) Transcript_24559:294-1466(-)|eukprot:XP_005760148.1 hypothetical protein EMIHUDRAFT_438508 [Emiliania huxleyi CCMP1516]